MRSLRLSLRYRYLILLLVTILVMASPVVAWDRGAEKLAYSLGWDKGVVVVLDLVHGQYGTGWLISPKYVVTAAHVTRNQMIQVTVVKGDKEVDGVVVAVDTKNDVEIIRLSEPINGHVFPLRPTVRKGETIYVMGFPFELAQLQGYDWKRISANPRVARGLATWVDNYKGLVELGTYVDAGNSGGPVIDDNGDVVGLVTFALPGEAATMYFATSAQAVINLCDEYGIPYQLAKVSMGSITDDIIRSETDTSKYTWILAGAGLVAIIAIAATLIRRR